MNYKSDNIRLFVGTHINFDQVFSECKLNLLQEYFNVPIKWVEKENIHMTWKFIGDVEYDNFDQILNTLHESVNSIGNIKIIFKKFAAWPNNRFPRQLVIVGDDTNGKAANLYNDINRRLVECSVKMEKHQFNPHITLARFKFKNKPVEPVNIPDCFKFDEITVNISQLDLIKSVLTPKGSIYTVLNTYNLKV